MSEPAYIETYRRNELKRRIEKANKILEECSLCARKCEVNRMRNERGICRTGRLPMVSSFSPHFGEEAPLVGRHGSGAIFITNCNLLCVFCQNWEISHLGEGEEISLEQFALLMINLQNIGCHNINFVTPTHVVPQILEALSIAIEGGLSVPLVYNTGGYDSIETINLLDGIFDIYMPDFKYWDEEVAIRLSKAPGYPEIARQAIKEMHRQVGDLTVDSSGIAQRGLLVRHLVLPDGLAGTRDVMRFLAREISPNTYVNIMDQYRPCGEAYKYPPLDRRITAEEYREAITMAGEEGINRLDPRKRTFILY
ncbi:MAG: radical SAM protein [Deltaproteobacteria bacterium]|nr:radical SAM protein [Deltaproteobacteria bacterium]